MFSKHNKQAGFQHFLGLPIAYEISVGAIVFRRGPDGVEYLLLQYPHGHWDFAKGHMEEGETREETLRREVVEETGMTELEIVPGFETKTRYFYVARGTEREKRREQRQGVWIFKVVYFYLAEVKQGDVVLSHEHIGYAWLPFEEALERLTFAGKLLRQAEAFLTQQDRI